MKKHVLRFGIPFAAVGAIITLLTVLTVSADFGLDPHSRAADFWFCFGMTVMTPPMTVGDLLGIPYNASPSLWGFLAVTTNMILCFLIGALLGAVVYGISRLTPKGDEIAS